MRICLALVFIMVNHTTFYLQMHGVSSNNQSLSSFCREFIHGIYFKMCF